MIVGIGVDLVSVARLERWLPSSDTGFVNINGGGLIQRFFHPAEVRACLDNRYAPAQALAARFGAKEALGKALGTGIRGFSLREVEVYNAANGQPLLRLHGAASAVVEQNGVSRIHLSLSHERDYAAAMVVLEG